MKRELKYFVLGALATFAGAVVAQNPTIFAAIRVNGSSDLRGDVVSNVGDVTVDDNLVVTGTCTGCGGAPGGANTQVQYNDGGVLGGDAGLTYVEGTDALTVSGLVTAGSITSVGALSLNGVVTTDNTSADEVGYKGVPQSSQSGNYTLVLTDSARHVYHPSGGGAGDTYTIPANSSVAFPVGTVVTFLNDDSNSITVAITTDTLTMAGTVDTAPCTMTENSMATALKVTSTSWIINGTGITC